jgi:V8-like Glu-specific endopeptidase
MPKIFDTLIHVTNGNNEENSLRESTQIVFPPDERTRINPTTVPVYNAIGQLEMTFPNGETYTGTGTLISPNAVLTAAHNLFGNDIGGWAKTVKFTPAKNVNEAPFGYKMAAQLYIPELYKRLSPPDPLTAPYGNVEDYSLYMYDFGLVKFKDGFYDISEQWGLYSATDTDLETNRVIITGYPGDKQPQNTMWTEEGNVDSFDKEFLFYTIDTFKGQSGAAVEMRKSYPAAIGVHVAGSKKLKTNFAVRLTEDKVSTIQSWM